MPPASDPSGFLLLLLFIFLPGLGAGEVLGLWRKDETLGERIGLALGLGLALDTVTMMARTSGVAILGMSLTGVDALTVYAVIIAGIGGLMLSVAIRKEFAFPTRPRATDLILLLTSLTLVSLLLLYYQKYPIFPGYFSQDFGAHVQFAQQLQQGSLTSIPAGILYFGVHYQLASALVLVGGEPLVTVQQTMGLLVALSPLLFYFASARIFGSRGPALVATAVYVLSGTIWFDSVLNAGLYANFFGILASLFLIAAFSDLARQIRSRRLWLVFLIALTAAYFSHYTTATIIPSLLVVPLAKFLKDRSDYMRYFVPSVVSVVPVGLAVAVDPGLPAHVLSLAESGGGTLIGSTQLSSVLSPVPVVGYMAFLTFDDIGFAFLLLFALVGAYRLLRSKDPLAYIPIVWLLALLVAAPFNVSAWRFSLEALVPLTLLACFGVYTLLPKLKTVRKGKFTGYRRLAVVLFLLLTPLVAFSRGQTSTVDSLTGTQTFGTAQRQVYSALYWLKDNTPSNSSYLSVSDPRFQYSSLIMGRPTYYESVTTPSTALEAARQNGTRYIIVTRIALGVVSPPPWDTFPASSTSNLTLLFTNPDVRIYQLP